nr:MAG TPA: cysteine-rich protein [Caudoviricetes sp.]
MNFDVLIYCETTEHCPYCNEYLGTKIRYLETSKSSKWEDFLYDIGYYTGDDERNCEGEHRPLDGAQCAHLVEWLADNKPQHWDAIRACVQLAAHNDLNVYIRATW